MKLQDNPKHGTRQPGRRSQNFAGSPARASGSKDRLPETISDGRVLSPIGQFPDAPIGRCRRT